MPFRVKSSIEQLHLLKIYLHLFFLLIPPLESTLDGFFCILPLHNQGFMGGPPSRGGILQG
jgi:hypothetical protein